MPSPSRLPRPPPPRWLRRFGVVRALRCPDAPPSAPMRRGRGEGAAGRCGRVEAGGPGPRPWALARGLGPGPGARARGPGPLYLYLRIIPRKQYTLPLGLGVRQSDNLWRGSDQSLGFQYSTQEGTRNPKPEALKPTRGMILFQCVSCLGLGPPTELEMVHKG